MVVSFFHLDIKNSLLLVSDLLFFKGDELFFIGNVFLMLSITEYYSITFWYFDLLSTRALLSLQMSELT